MRVGYVVKRYPRYSETFIVNEVLAHERAGWELDLFAIRPSVDTHFQDRIAQVRAGLTVLHSGAPKATPCWQKLHEAGRRMPRLWDVVRSADNEDILDVYQSVLLAEEVVRRGIGHLHAHFATGPATVARLAAAMAGVTFSFTAHAKDIFHESVCHEDLRRKLQSAAAVVTVSNFNLAYLREEFGRDAARVRRIYNGMDLTELEFSSPETRPPRILAVGRLVEKKGFGDLIRACALLRDRGLPFECDILGDGDLADSLHAEVDRLGLTAQCRLLGPQPQTRVIEALRRAAVMAVPCVVGDDGNRDGLPTVLLEAMALGTPCISTPVTGIPEVVHHQETGLLVGPRDPEQLAAALQQLLADAALRQRLAFNARVWIERHFDIDENTSVLRQMFQAAGTSQRGAPLAPSGELVA